MKQFYTLHFTAKSILGFLLLLSAQMGTAQCLNGTVGLPTPFVPAYTQNDELIDNIQHAGTYFLVSIQPGKTYTFLSQFANNLSLGYQGYITISNAEGTVPYVWGEGVVDWDSGLVTGNVRFYVHSVNCSNGSVPIRRSVMAYHSPCKPPTAPNTSNLTSTSVTFNWSQPATMVPSNGYQYYVSESYAPPFNFVSAFPTGYSLNTSLNYNFLEPGTTYNWWVRSYCGNSVSYWVQGGNFTTPTISCNLPTNLTAANITSTSAELSWTPPNPAPANGYQYAINQSGLPPNNANSVPSNSITFNALVPNATYYWYIRSDCGFNNYSNWAFGGTFTTSNSLSCNNAVFPMSPTALFTPSCTGAAETISTTAKAGQYSKVNIQANKQYTLASSVSTDFITVTDESGNGLLAFGPTPLSWASGSNSGVVRFFIHTDAACGTSATARTKTISCSAGVTSCEGPSALFASQVTASSALLGWSVPSSAPFAGYQYYLNTSGTAPTAGTVANGTTSASFAGVGGLVPGVTYYFWVRSDCGATKSAWISGGSFTTTAVSGCAEPLSPNVTNITSNSAYFSWTEPVPNPSNGYEVYISTLSLTPTVAQTPTGYVDDGGTTFYDLFPATTFYFWVRSACSGSTSAWIYGGSFNTVPALVCNGATYGLYPTPTFTPACTGAQETINADAWPGEFSCVSVIANRQYTFSSSVATDFITITNEAGNTILASGTSPVMWSSNTFSGTVRYFLHTDNSCGIAQSARTRWVRCGSPGICAAPSGIVVSSITTVGATISWSPANPVPSDGYQYYLNTTGIAPSTETFAWGFVPGNSFTIAFLQPGTTYYIWVRSDCGNGASSSWAAGGSFNTLSPTPCIAPTGFSVFDITPGGATIGCTPTVPEPANGYEYYLNLTGVTPSNDTAAWGDLIGNSYTISFVAPGTTYYFWIRSDCGASQSAWIPGGSFTTLTNTSCPTPFNPFTTDVTANSAELHWTVSETAPLYDLYLSTSSVPPTPTTPTWGSVNNMFAFVAAGIATNTTYYWWVRSNCGGETSVWIYGGAFTTTTLGVTTNERHKFSAFPNPVEAVLNVSADEIIEKLELYNMIGQKVREKKARARQTSIDLSGLQSGTYLLKVNAGGYSQSSKVIKR